MLAKKPTGSLAFPGWNFSDELLLQTPIEILNSSHRINSFMDSIPSNRNINYSFKEMKQIENLCLLDGNASKIISADIIKLVKFKNSKKEY